MASKKLPFTKNDYQNENLCTTHTLHVCCAVLLNHIPSTKRAASTIITGEQLPEIVGLNQDCRYQQRRSPAVHGASIIDNPHTILMIFQLHIFFVRIANHLCNNSKPIWSIYLVLDTLCPIINSTTNSKRGLKTRRGPQQKGEHLSFPTIDIPVSGYIA